MKFQSREWCSSGRIWKAGRHTAPPSVRYSFAVHTSQPNRLLHPRSRNFLSFSWQNSPSCSQSCRLLPPVTPHPLCPALNSSGGDERDPHVPRKTACSPSSALCVWHFCSVSLEAGSFRLREGRALGHGRAEPESWKEPYKWGQDSRTGRVPAVAAAEAISAQPPSLLSAVVHTKWGFGILYLLCPIVFSKLTWGSAVCIDPFTEDQKLVWRQLPCLAPLPL